MPLARVDGELGPLSNDDWPVLEPADTEAALHHAARRTACAWPSSTPSSEIDLSHEIAGVARFRINTFRQRGGVSLVARAIPHRIRTIDELALPAVIARARRRAARDHPRHRDDRLRQVDDARGDDRPHQRHARGAHRHDRGSDRVRPPRHALDDQPARGRRRHRLVQARAAARAAPGPGRDPDRRDARRGDRADRDVGRRDRPPRALDDPHVDAAESINRMLDFFPPHQHQQVRSMLAGTLRGVDLASASCPPPSAGASRSARSCG